MEISITWNICRVCLQEGQKSSNGVPMMQIFSGDNKMAKQIFECSGVTMQPNDSLPDKICQKCISVLKYAVNFRKTCINSDTYLQSVLQRTKLASNLFKPEGAIDFEDDILTDDPTDFREEGEKHKQEQHKEQTDEELENKEILKRKHSESRNVSKTFKKVKSLDASTSSIVMETIEKNTQMELHTNMDDVVAQVNEEHVDTVPDDDSNSKVKMKEGIIQNANDIMEQMFSNTTNENSQIRANTEEENEVVEVTEDDLEHCNTTLKRKPTILQEFYENANYTKLSKENQQQTKVEDTENAVDDDDDYDIIETPGDDEQITKQHNNNELYYIYKDSRIENGSVENNIPNDEDENDHIEATVEDGDEDENLETEDNVDFMPLYEEEHEVMLQLEQNMEDNQSLVTSTVITNDNEAGDNDDDNNYNEENSNLSNETQGLPTEYIIDEYLIEDSSSNNSSQNSHATIQTNKLQKNSTTSFTTSNKKRNSVILSGRRSKTKSDPSTKASKHVFICNSCGNHFKNRQLLNVHIKVHRQEKNHECEICFKRFITACNLQAHMRIHTGEKPFECQYCGRRFNDRSSNLRHERTHTNEKPFHCVHCGKAFALATTLHAHIKVHTGERSYRCDACAKSFKLPHQLKAHQNSTLHKAVEQLIKLEN